MDGWIGGTHIPRTAWRWDSASHHLIKPGCYQAKITQRHRAPQDTEHSFQRANGAEPGDAPCPDAGDHLAPDPLW